jgi:hypothetical protein
LGKPFYRQRFHVPFLFAELSRFQTLAGFKSGSVRGPIVRLSFPEITLKFKGFGKKRGFFSFSIEAMGLLCWNMRYRG